VKNCTLGGAKFFQTNSWKGTSTPPKREQLEEGSKIQSTRGFGTSSQRPRVSTAHEREPIDKGQKTRQLALSSGIQARDQRGTDAAPEHRVD
jgi:hypothetical protein